MPSNEIIGDIFHEVVGVWATIGTEPNHFTGLWMVKPKYSTICGLPYQSMGVLHLDSVVHGAHLLPLFPSNTWVYWDID